MNKMETELLFTREGVIVKGYIETPFGLEQTEKKKSYGEISGIDGIELTVTSIEPLIENGVLKAIKMRISDYKKIKTIAPDEDDILRKRINKGLEKREWPDYVRTYAKALLNKKTEAHWIRKVIKEMEKISDKELRRMLKEAGYNEKSGSVNAIVYVLANVTEEVKIEGRGNQKVYKWVG